MPRSGERRWHGHTFRRAA